MLLGDIWRNARSAARRRRWRARDGIRQPLGLSRAGGAPLTDPRPSRRGRGERTCGKAAPGWLAYASLLVVAVGSGRRCSSPESGRRTPSPTTDRQPSALAARQSSDRCRLLGPAYGQAVVRRAQRGGAAGRRSRRRGFSAGRRPPRRDRRQPGPRTRLPAARACDQRVRAAGIARQSRHDPDPPRLYPASLG